MNDKKKFSY